MATDKNSGIINKLKSLSFLNLFQILLIFSITFKTLKSYYSPSTKTSEDLKGTSEDLKRIGEDTKKIGAFVYESLNNRLSLNKDTFILRFETFISQNSEDSFYKMPSTAEGRKRELGRAGWILLHNIGIKYPHIPTNEQKTDLENFLSLFGKLYPCGECRPHFKRMLTENPPNFETHEKFNQWLSKIHNIVNKRIGNKIFDYTKLNDRWDCGCKLDSFE